MSLVLKDGMVVVIEADQTGQHFHQVGWGVQRHHISLGFGSRAVLAAALNDLSHILNCQLHQ